MHDRMRICIVAPGYPGRVNPWNGILIREETHNLSRLSCQAIVVTSRVFKEDPPFCEDDSVKVYRFWFPSQRKLLAEYEKIPFIRVGIYLLCGIIKILRVARKERCDLLHAHWAIPAGFMAVIAGKLLRKPVVVTVHDADIMTFPAKSRIAATCIKFSLHQANVIISVNNILKETVVKEFNIDVGKIQLIPLGIDRPLLKPLDKSEARQRLGLPAKRKLILFVGALLEIKGVQPLIESIPEIASRHEDVLFVLVGGGPLEGEIRSRIRDLGLEDFVKVAGQRSHDEIPVWMSAADALVVPSLSEGRPRVGLEALAIGLPVIASKVGAITEIIENGRNGLLVEPGNSRAIADALNLILEREELLTRLKESATLKPEYDARVAAERIRQVYLDLLRE